MKKHLKAIAFIFILLLFLSVVCLVNAETYVVVNGKKNAEIKSIVSSNTKMMITYDFWNNSSSGTSFSWSFTVKVYQNGIACDALYFDSNNKNSGVDVKNGAHLEVTDTYSLRDNTSIVEIEIGSWGFMRDSKVIYFNPQTQKFGSKQDVANVTATPQPTPTPVIRQNNSEFKVSTPDQSWTCPNCGAVASSRFCPDCGIASPSPEPTPTPTPSPTEVPMDLSKSTEKVAQYPYTLRCINVVEEGIYTGEIIDGFPHGYGVFETEKWFYIGQWEKGIPTDKGTLYYKDEQNEDSFSSLIIHDDITQVDKIEIGNTILFGHFEQDNNNDNGKEQIKWKVLDIINGKALLISQYALAVKPYNTKDGKITWEECSLRKWLNEEFLESVFSKKERLAILPTIVENGPKHGNKQWTTDGGNNTQDYIFLLSIAEMEKYMGNNDDLMIAQLTKSAYAQIKMKSHYANKDGKIVGLWWLRSPGYSKTHAAFVAFNGVVRSYAATQSECVVRPSMWIDLKYVIK